MPSRRFEVPARFCFVRKRSLRCRQPADKPAHAHGCRCAGQEGQSCPSLSRVTTSTPCIAPPSLRPMPVPSLRRFLEACPGSGAVEKDNVQSLAPLPRFAWAACGVLGAAAAHRFNRRLPVSHQLLVLKSRDCYTAVSATCVRSRTLGRVQGSAAGPLRAQLLAEHGSQAHIS